MDGKSEREKMQKENREGKAGDLFFLRMLFCAERVFTLGGIALDLVSFCNDFHHRSSAGSGALFLLPSSLLFSLKR